MTRAARPTAKRPLVIAHRGASAERAEHTLAAYVRAIELGSDGVECDVRLTRDGQLVCIHDRTVDRTSNGSGAVSSMPLAQLQRLDFGSWFGGDPASVLTVAALVELVHDAGRPVRLFVEVKHPTRYGGQVERQLVATLQRVGWLTRDSPVTVMSFADSALHRMHKRAPALPLVLLLSRVRGTRRIGLLPEAITIAGPDMELLRRDPGFVERARTLGNQVYVWTVDELDDLWTVRRLGVDAVITNRPGEAISALGAAVTRRPDIDRGQ